MNNTHSPNVTQPVINLALRPLTAPGPSGASAPEQLTNKQGGREGRTALYSPTLPLGKHTTCAYKKQQLAACDLCSILPTIHPKGSSTTHSHFAHACLQGHKCFDQHTLCYSVKYLQRSMQPTTVATDLVLLPSLA